MSKAIILVGATGCGKTHFTKNMIRSVNKNALLIFDVNDEYKSFSDMPFNPNMDKFLDRIYDSNNDTHRIKKAVILLEDATSFFSTRGSDSVLTKMLVAKRHSGNTYILLFHGMQDVPKYIVRKCTDMVIFKTNDNPKYVEREFDYLNIYQNWKAVQEKAKNNAFYSSQPPPKNTKPDFVHFSLY